MKKNNLILDFKNNFVKSITACFVILSLFFLPTVSTFAQSSLGGSILSVASGGTSGSGGSTGALNTISNLVNSSSSILGKVAGLMMTLAFIAFMAAVINFLIKRSKGESNGLDQAKNMLFWSVIAMFVMVAIWGLTYFLANNLGIFMGGCAPKPSPIPGQTVQDDCGGNSRVTNGSSAASCSSTSNRPNNCSCSSGSQCSSGNCNSGFCRAVSASAGSGSRECNSPSDCGSFGTTCVNGKCVTGQQNIVNTCESDQGNAAANGDVLNCKSGVSGEPCQSGTCAWGYRCEVIDSSGGNGTCVKI